MILGALGVSVLLTAVTITKYLLDVPYLRRESLEHQARAVARALAERRDPARLPQFRLHPHHYGFRIFSDRLAQDRRLLGQANTDLLPPMATDAQGNAKDLDETFQVFAGPRTTDPQRWQLVEREQIAGHHHYWVQTTMVGDPAWLWTGVVAGEMMDHVIVPFLTIVPVLTLTMFMTTRSVLRPLTRLSAQAEEIGRAVTAGRTLAPLAAEGLPREIAAVVLALNAMLAQLERSISVQKQFTADVAHELRTPLAVMQLGTVQLPDSPRRRQLQADLQGLGELVHQLLRFAQAEDALVESRSPVDVVAVARKVCEEVAPDAVRRRLTIEFDAPETAAVVRGNGTLIEIAIRNLVENAVKFAPPQTVVSVAVDASAAVSVADRGPGVPDNQKDRAFHRFWRSATEQGGGAGVGLALVRRVAHLHEGDARLEDRPDGGTRAVLAFGVGYPSETNSITEAAG
ncbi:MAG: HAMP domain-containing histidine kinase [Rhodospirillales bacterium]|nr:HAMP domain-containing histidine kinase [Rhodospirillales bacterium]